MRVRCCDHVTGEDDVLRLRVELYQALLKGSLGPKARKMFEHLLAQARGKLGALDCQP